MTPLELLERLDALGVVVEPTGEPDHPVRLHPVGSIPEELRPEVVAHKRELAALLRQRTWQAEPPSTPWHTRPGEDPRPDLPRSDLWSVLLRLAAGDGSDPHGTYGRLLGARACGAILERRSGRWKLAPTIDPGEQTSVWQDREAWEADAQRWLRPKSREILALLGQLSPSRGTAGGRP